MATELNQPVAPVAPEANLSHKIKYKRTYSTWCSMKKRCRDKDNFKYGGRGIIVCDRWNNSFLSFLEDMGERPEGLTIDRIDNNGNYCKKNCKWSTIEEQNNNTRRNKYIKYKGITKTLSQWIKHFNLKSSTVRNRFYVHKWDINKCFNYK